MRGDLIRGMSRRELAVLDWFEDEAYVPTRVEVETDAGATETVTCYLWDDTTPNRRRVRFAFSSRRTCGVRRDVRGVPGGRAEQRLAAGSSAGE